MLQSRLIDKKSRVLGLKEYHDRLIEDYSISPLSHTIEAVGENENVAVGGFYLEKATTLLIMLVARLHDIPSMETYFNTLFLTATIGEEYIQISNTCDPDTDDVAMQTIDNYKIIDLIAGNYDVSVDVQLEQYGFPVESPVGQVSDGILTIIKL